MTHNFISSNAVVPVTGHTCVSTILQTLRWHPETMPIRLMLIARPAITATARHFLPNALGFRPAVYPLNSIEIP